MSAVAAASASDALGSKKRKQDDISIPSLVGSGAVSSATSLSNGNGGTTRTTHAPPNKMFWQWTVDEIGEWVRGLSALFPPAPTAPSSKAGTTKPSEADNVDDTGTQVSAGGTTPPLSEEQEAQFQAKVAEWDASNKLNEEHASHLLNAILSATTKQGTAGYEDDKFHIMDSGFARGERVVHVPGALLSRLGIGGLTNALAGVPGGLVDPGTNIPLKNDDGAVASAKVVPPGIVKMARIVMRAISARLEMDMMESTPYRIAEMLSPESSPAEIAAIRKRIVDTVLLGKGTHSSAAAAALENTDDLPVAAKVDNLTGEKWMRCKTCGNNNQSAFAMDRKNGDMICTECGTVAMESLMHEGSQFRKFEGEADRNHHGDTPNVLYSNAHNMSTTLGGMAGGMGMMSGKGGGMSGLENVLRNAHAYTEMNISQFGKDEKKTRIGYKDRQKKDAFMKMNHAGDSLNLHDAVVQRAKELFAGFRDDRELVQQFKGVVAGCLCEAFDQLSRDGRRILKVRAGDVMDDEGDEEEVGNGPRATWRQAMHNSTAASKGDAFFKDVPDYLKNTNSGSSTPAAQASAVMESELERKSVATWDLDDVRSWLLEASRAIAKQWIDLRRLATEQTQEANGNGDHDGKNGNENGQSSAPTPIDVSKIPSGSLDELEGQLVECTFMLCDHLEQEINSKSSGNQHIAGKKLRVTTPRVNMAHLGIRWQGSHERGSGGKGGVGNSGRSANGIKPGERRGTQRAAGQILILKTKKLSVIMKDPVAGEAFHKELRAILARQDAMKRRDRSNLNAQKRFHQMNRKPWLNEK